MSSRKTRVPIYGLPDISDPLTLLKDLDPGFFLSRLFALGEDGVDGFLCHVSASSRLMMYWLAVLVPTKS